MKIFVLLYTNIVLWQGGRGLDGDPGPQGVAGATVSFSHDTNAFILAANVVRMSRLWFNALFQGDRGQRGVMGEPGPRGETVSRCINNLDVFRCRKQTLIHWNLLLCCAGYSREERNHRTSRSQGRGCECLIWWQIKLKCSETLSANS